MRFSLTSGKYCSVTYVKKHGEGNMKYGEIKWKIEKVVFLAKDGVITQKSEIDEGKTFISKSPRPVVEIKPADPPVQSC